MIVQEMALTSVHLKAIRFTKGNSAMNRVETVQINTNV